MTQDNGEKARLRRRTEAEARQAEHDALNLQDKIDKATNRGGSKRELRRLHDLAPADWVDVKTGQPKGGTVR